jgi:hypothetical protein
MAGTTAHLVDEVLPAQRLRQWVFTFPQPLPRLLAWEPDLLRRTLAVVTRAVGASLRRRTHADDGRAGLVSFKGTDAPSLEELERLGETHEQGLSKAERAPARHRRWIATHGGVEVHAGVMIEAGVTTHPQRGPTAHDGQGPLRRATCWGTPSGADTRTSTVRVTFAPGSPERCWRTSSAVRHRSRTAWV